MDNLVYRAIHANENPEFGLYAALPNRGMSAEGHVRNGMRHNGSQFISSSKTPVYPLFYGAEQQRRIAAIDLSLCEEILDVSKPNPYIRN
jgi:hypothetical protein